VNKDEKVRLVGELKDRFERAKIVILFNYKGVNVQKVNALRRALDKVGDLDLRVVKNTLARRAIAGSKLSPLADDFVGPNAVLFGYGEPVAPVKELLERVKGIEAVEVRVGMLDGRKLSREDIQALAKLPSREQLLAILLGTMQAPARNFVSLLAQVPRGLLNVLTALKEQKEKEAA